MSRCPGGARPRGVPAGAARGRRGTCGSRRERVRPPPGAPAALAASPGREQRRCCGQVLLLNNYHCSNLSQAAALGERVVNPRCRAVLSLNRSGARSLENIWEKKSVGDRKRDRGGLRRCGRRSGPAPARSALRRAEQLEQWSHTPMAKLSPALRFSSPLSPPCVCVCKGFQKHSSNF